MLKTMGKKILKLYAEKFCLSKPVLIPSGSRKTIFLFLNRDICCGYSKEPSQGDGSFEHPKLMHKNYG